MLPNAVSTPLARPPRGTLRLLSAAALAVAAWGAAPAAAGTNPACGDGVRILRGDTLARVASHCWTTVSALLAANPGIYSPDLIRVGDVIWMPGRGPARPHLPEAPLPPVLRPGGDACSSPLTVRRGDTLAAIARRCGVSTRALLDANPEIVHPSFIWPGMRLTLPRGAEPSRPQLPLPATLHVTGTVTAEGATCRAMRGDDGRLYTLAGASVPRLQPGDRIRVTGTRAAVSYCQQGTTIDVRRVERLAFDWDEEEPPILREITGTLTREGVTCPAMRGDDGRLYTLAGDSGGFRPGDRVRVTGGVAEVSVCQQGTTLEVVRIRSAG